MCLTPTLGLRVERGPTRPTRRPRPLPRGSGDVVWRGLVRRRGVGSSAGGAAGRRKRRPGRGASTRLTAQPADGGVPGVPRLPGAGRRPCGRRRCRAGLRGRRSSGPASRTSDRSSAASARRSAASLASFSNWLASSYLRLELGRVCSESCLTLAASSVGGDRLVVEPGPGLVALAGGAGVAARRTSSWSGARGVAERGVERDPLAVRTSRRPSRGGP